MRKQRAGFTFVLCQDEGEAGLLPGSKIQETERRIMDERTFQKRFASLLEGIGDLPVEAQESLMRWSDTDVQTQSRSQFLDSLDALRMGLTYVVFDLEATRRENRFLRRLLDDEAAARSDARDREQDGEGEGESVHDEE
jgi:hypothetical protein